MQLSFGPQAAQAMAAAHYANEAANRTDNIMKKLILKTLALAVLPLLGKADDHTSGNDFDRAIRRNSARLFVEKSSATASQRCRPSANFSPDEPTTFYQWVQMNHSRAQMVT